MEGREEGCKGVMMEGRKGGREEGWKDGKMEGRKGKQARKESSKEG